MSAFMVSHDCIHRVVFALRANQPQLNSHDPDLLGMLLIELNRRALKARYGSMPEVEPYTYEPVTKCDTTKEIMQIFKSLRCFLYQCSEGDMPDQPLFEQTLEVRERMALALGYDERHASSFKQPALREVYDACEWG